MRRGAWYSKLFDGRGRPRPYSPERWVFTYYLLSKRNMQQFAGNFELVFYPSYFARYTSFGAGVPSGGLDVHALGDLVCPAEPPAHCRVVVVAGHACVHWKEFTTTTFYSPSLKVPQSLGLSCVRPHHMHSLRVCLLTPRVGLPGSLDDEPALPRFEYRRKVGPEPPVIRLAIRDDLLAVLHPHHLRAGVAFHLVSCGTTFITLDVFKFNRSVVN